MEKKCNQNEHAQNLYVINIPLFIQSKCFSLKQEVSAFHGKNWAKSKLLIDKL